MWFHRVFPAFTSELDAGRWSKRQPALESVDDILGYSVICNGLGEIAIP